MLTLSRLSYPENGRATASATAPRQCLIYEADFGFPGSYCQEFCSLRPESGGVLKDSIGNDSTFKNESNSVMPVESSPESAG